jgi:Domain of unknown function (DUF4845)
MHSAFARRQQGMTLIGLMFFSALLIFFVYAAFRLVPAYIDYYSVKHTLNEMARDSDLVGKPERAYRETFERHLDMDQIKVVTRDDLDIEEHDNGARLSVDWSVKEPFLGPVHLCLDFHAESAPAARVSR